MRRLLFVCSQNKLRSLTAETVFSEYSGVAVDSAGVNRGAEIVLSEEQVEWAEVIFVMEKRHRVRLNQMFGHVLAGKKIVVLGIPDQYDYMDERLIALLKSRCRNYLPEA